MRNVTHVKDEYDNATGITSKLSLNRHNCRKTLMTKWQSQLKQRNNSVTGHCIQTVNLYGAKSIAKTKGKGTAT